jgi:hypothetical protein
MRYRFNVDALISRRVAIFPTRNWLARKAGISETGLRQYEAGIRTPTGPILVALADALGCDPKDLLTLVADEEGAA